VETTTGTERIAQASAAEAAQIQIKIQNGFYSAGRPTADLDAHPLRKPEQVIAWAGVNEGMSIIDIGAYGGYYSENLAWAVGLDGWVIAQNAPGELDRFGGRNRVTLETRLAGTRLPQIETIEIAYDEIADEFDELDAATFVNILHDIYNSQGEEASVAVLNAIYNTLLPGGFLILIDHLGLAGNDNTELHRIDPEIARQLLEQAGFVIEEESDLLAVADDNANVRIFDESVRGKTHRFIIKAVKPAG
jgi:predicted methyltransferase